MPNYAEPFGRIGGVAGGTAGAAGGGLLGRLGDLLAPLDYPRQALWNLARSAGNAVTGEGNWDDALRAMPGALGGALTGGLMATGFGAPLGVLAGSALGGLAQGVGKAADAEKFSAPEVGDLTGTEDFAPNFLIGALTDPLSYAGGLGGAKRGAAAGRQYGKGLEEAAVWRGPNYPGGVGKLEEALIGAKGSDSLQDLVREIRSNPAALSELPPGSTFLGNGAQTAAFRTPENSVVSFITSGGDTLPTRPDVPEMLQAARSKLYEGNNPIRVEHTPMLDTFKRNVPGESAADLWARRQAMYDSMMEMKKAMEQRGVSFFDHHLGNVGKAPDGKMFILDPGALEDHLIGGWPVPGALDEHLVAGAPIPRVPDLAAHEPSRVQSALLKLLGGEQSVREELTQGLKEYRGGGSVLPTIPERRVRPDEWVSPRGLTPDLRAAEQARPPSSVRAPVAEESVRTALLAEMERYATDPANRTFRNPNRWMEEAVHALGSEDARALAQAHGIEYRRPFDVFEELKQRMWDRYRAAGIGQP